MDRDRPSSDRPSRDRHGGRRARIGLVLAIAAGLAACGAMTPYQPHRGSDIPAGPGLLSGEDGEFTVIRR